jgi:hypothetical protein
MRAGSNTGFAAIVQHSNEFDLAGLSKDHAVAASPTPRPSTGLPVRHYAGRNYAYAVTVAR